MFKSFIICLSVLLIITTPHIISYGAEIKMNDTEVKNSKSTQIIEMEDNKINVIVMKQPLNEKSNQKITLKRNWLGVYIQVNGKVKVNPLTSTYEVE